MDILLTLDYELFLGSKTGSVEKCLIIPMQELQIAADRYGVKFTIFSDATFLYMLNQYRSKYDKASKDFKMIVNHLCQLDSMGHDVQLHIHPHWFYSSFNGEQWNLDNGHYKLCDLSFDEASRVFSESKKILDDVLGKKTIAFRAGGFSTQPTAMLKKMFESNGIMIDTSVCPHTSYHSSHQDYDYINCPNDVFYHFGDDICKADSTSSLVEVPLSMYKVSPFFYWLLVANKFMKAKKHIKWGDGISVQTAKDSIIERLTRYTYNMATIDGYKTMFLNDAYNEARSSGREIFCVLGHPKLITPYSVEKFYDFCKFASNNGDNFLTISELYEKYNY